MSNTNQRTTEDAQKELQKAYHFMNSIEGYSQIDPLSTDVMEEYWNIVNETNSSRK